MNVTITFMSLEWYTLNGEVAFGKDVAQLLQRKEAVVELAV